MSLVTERRTEKLLVEASLAYIKNPTPEGREEVAHYAKMLLRIRGEK